MSSRAKQTVAIADAASAGQRAKRSYDANDQANLNIDEWPPSKRDLYHVARRLFWEKGFAETSISDLVSEAGLSKGAFYHYFDSKQKLLEIMYAVSLARVLPDLQEQFRHEQSAVAALTKYAELMVDVMSRFKFEINIFWDQQRRLPDDMFPENRASRLKLQKLMIDLISRGIQEGEIRSKLPPKVLYYGLHGMCQFTQYWVKEGAKTPKQIGVMLAELFMDGARDQSGGRSSSSKG